jgi:threonine/homoserine/homoserine lactone efflux protein
MTKETLFALTIFALVTSITPGPNNIMLLASGANFGFRRTIPHVMGVNLGFTFLILLTGVGLIQLFDLFPILHTILKVFSAGYLTYLALKIARSGPASNTSESTGQPLTFTQAALFQWVNPKAWTMALSAISLYSTETATLNVLLITFIFTLVNLPCVCAWTVLGQQFSRVMTNSFRVKLFNITMAILLLGTLVHLSI